MINWFDMPAEGLSNGGLFEVKELEVTENGTYEQSGEMYNKVIVNVEGGGGSWQTVFEGSVTTVDSYGVAEGIVEGLTSLSADTIKITFNGTEYTCENNNGEYGAPRDEESGEFDFSEYPFAIGSAHDMVTVWTESAGTYTLKIEEQQSGGSSDFSTAEVTVTYTGNDVLTLYMPIYYEVPDLGIVMQGWTNFDEEEPTDTLTVVIPTEGEFIVGGNVPQFTSSNTQVTGSARVENGMLIITGDCTITIS